MLVQSLLALLALSGEGVLGFSPMPRAHHSLAARDMTMELFVGNPVGKKIWDIVWAQDVMKPGEAGVSPTSFGDAATVLRTNIEQVYGGEPSYDGAPIAEGEVEGLLDGALFLAFREYYNKFGGVFKLLFGPKSFIVVSDPVIYKHILRDNAKAYDKGVLAEILEPIMGKGLIPADPETWKQRRRAIVPGFHKKWLSSMCNVFVNCNGPLIDKMNAAVENDERINMETEFCSVSLDIIGKSVFNYEFGSVTNESPVIQAVYSALKEAEHRSLTPFPYWNIPFANTFVPRLRKFNADLKILNDVLNELVEKALETQNQQDEEELQNRDYDTMENPSLLRFLVDMRGEESSSTQLRDDLMTMLIAGHETTAAVLTWAFFELAQQPELVNKVVAEIESVLGDRDPTYDDVANLKLLRLVVAESLRKYPEPPLLIRRALEDDVLPGSGTGFPTKIMRGTDLFLAIYNVHMSEEFWEDPEKFDPERFLRPSKNTKRPDWAGYEPNDATLYPNEVQSDFAYLPFGGGSRKCVGDQFACMEAVITLAMLLRRFEISLDMKPEDVGMFTGATIHTRNGLFMKFKKRGARVGGDMIPAKVDEIYV
jgi:cytochrome P450